MYGFRHYTTPAGRRVEFTIAREDYERAMARVPPAYFDGVAREDDVDGVHLTMTVAAAARLSEALVGAGGDSVITGRLLADQLDAVLEEIQRSRSIGATSSRGPRRDLRAAVGF